MEKVIGFISEPVTIVTSISCSTHSLVPIAMKSAIPLSISSMSSDSKVSAAAVCYTGGVNGRFYT